jgi:hypothetical protein
MSGPLYTIGTYAQISASTKVNGNPGDLLGILVSSASATPTITIYDNTAASGTQIVAQFTPTAGQWYPMPCAYNTGLYVALGGTVACTVFYR